MRVLVTRAEPAATRTAEMLEAGGHAPLVLPLFKLKDMATALPENGWSDIIFTSANAVEVLTRRNWSPPSGITTAWCVGKRTADAAAKLGFGEVRTAEGGGESLFEKILRVEPEHGRRFLYPTTPDRVFDMAGRLGEQGISCKSVDIYRMENVFPDRVAMRGKLQEVESGAILVYSARSASHLLQCIEDSGSGALTLGIAVVAISRSAAIPLQGAQWADIRYPDNPDEASMLALIDRLRPA